MDIKHFLNDGSCLSGNYDLEKYLTSLGFNIDELYMAVTEIVGESTYEDVLSASNDKADEYERVADGYYQDIHSLVGNMEVAIDKLESGKSGKGYTKNDIAQYLRTAINELECY